MSCLSYPMKWKAPWLPCTKYDPVTVKQARGSGLAKELLRIALLNIEREYQNQPVRISAQQYLYEFYAAYGFEKVSEPYDEDGIPHIEMLKK